MATGGLGGVHRGFHERPDVSADLGELARTQALVVCVGGQVACSTCRRRCELLETLGVPVLGFRTDELPLFYARTRRAAGLGARRDAPRRRRAIALAHWELGRTTAVLLAHVRPTRASTTSSR